MIRRLVSSVPAIWRPSTATVLRFSSTVSSPQVENRLNPQDSTTSRQAAAKGKSRTTPKNRQVAPLPPLIENELEEEFMRVGTIDYTGRGPGGQVINKSSILVSLLHKPTGTRVKCQDSRSRETNRLLARRRMQEKLDLIWKGKASRTEMKRDRERMKKAAKKRKSRRKLESGMDDVDDPEGIGEEGGQLNRSLDNQK